MANFEGQKIEFTDADGIRRRFTIGSPEFKAWYDKTMSHILATDNRLEKMKNSVREVYGMVERPVNSKTGATVKSGTIKGKILSGKFDVKTDYKLIDNTAMDGEGRSQQAMLKAVYDLFGNEFISVEYKTKESFSKVTESEKFAMLGVDVNAEEKIQPSWKPTMIAVVNENSEAELKMKVK